MNNSMVVVTFYVLDWKHPFRTNLVQENRNCQFELKFVTLTYSNMQNSTMVFTFSVLDRKHPFWANLVKKIKIASLS